MRLSISTSSQRLRRSLVAAALLLAAVPASGEAYVIGPGVSADFPYSQCTLNFVFDGVGKAAGRVFVGTAAHCTSGPEPGDEVRMGGDVTRLGDVVGTVVAIGPYHSETENPSIDDDWALIEVRRPFHKDVQPAVQGHPQFPSRVVSAAEMSAGDVLQFSGHGVATGASQSAREQRQGQWVGGDDAGYDAFAPLMSSGDSGGPVVDVKTGGALGIASTVFRVFCGTTCTLEGPTIKHMIESATAQGIPIQLRPAGAKAPPTPPAPQVDPEPSSPPPAAQGTQPSAATPASSPRLRVAPAGRGCVRSGRITLRLRATPKPVRARVVAPGRRATVLRGRALSRPVRLTGLRGRRVRVTVTAHTADGARVTARRTFAAC